MSSITPIGPHERGVVHWFMAVTQLVERVLAARACDKPHEETHAIPPHGRGFRRAPPGKSFPEVAGFGGAGRVN